MSGSIRFAQNVQHSRFYFLSKRKLACVVRVALIRLLAVSSVILLFSLPAVAANQVQDFISKIEASTFFPQATAFGAAQGNPPLVPVLRGSEQIGFVYLNSDFVNSVGYSGKPIHLLVGIDLKGIITGIKLVGHSEPIVLVGIPEKRIIDAMNVLIGKDMQPVAKGTERPPQVDIVSGATLTVLVMGDSVIRSAVKIIRGGRLGGASASSSPVVQPSRNVNMSKSEERSWQELLGDGSIRHLHLSIGEVNDAFAKAGSAIAAERPETDNPDDTFIDLFIAPVSVPSIGLSLLGQAGYTHLASRLQPGQQALLVAGTGVYSFKGSAYVRGGIFDRIEIIQEGASTRFRDHNHTRLGEVATADAPPLKEIALFVVPTDFKLDLGQPWEVQLLVQRPTGVREKAFTSFELAYSLPDRYLTTPPAPAPGTTETAAQNINADTLPLDIGFETPLWQRIWEANTVQIGILLVAIGILTLIFFFQNLLVQNERVYLWVRRSYLLFILVWLGWYANAQLSVVNVITFTSALITGFSWEYFLGAPLIFILWSSIAAALLFWGRGPFCGWLCPFGALQELLSVVAKWFKVPQITLPWGLHERLWPIKYIIFLGLFGMSLYSVAAAEHLAEVEPFKTVIILKFVRDWPYVIYALTLLSLGLFVERFFCRYLCPLGAALAIPGRMRMFEWLKRWPECGSPCQRCAKECPVQSIHPEGHINVNECIYCMHCQLLYQCEKRCPHMIIVKNKRDKFKSLLSPGMTAKQPGSARKSVPGEQEQSPAPLPLAE